MQDTFTALASNATPGTSRPVGAPALNPLQSEKVTGLADDRSAVFMFERGDVLSEILILGAA